MFRVLGPGVLGLIFLALWVYCLFDVIMTDEAVMRNLPKMAWLLIVVFLSTIGCLAWLAAGRPLYAGWQPGSPHTRQPRQPRRDRPLGPDDDPNWR